MSSTSSLLRWILPLLGLILFWGLWELNSHYQLYRLFAPTMGPSTFPSTSAVLSRFAYLLGTSTSCGAIGTTLARTLGAFAISLLGGVLLGLVTARVFLANALIALPAEFLRNLPAIAALPIFIVFLGIGSTMKISLAVFGAIFPVFIATRSGLRYANEELQIAASYYGWKGWRLVFQVLLPSALPEILGAAQTGLAISLILIIMAEMLVGGDGLGAMIIDAERTFDYAQLYAVILLLGLVGTFLALLLRYGSGRLLYWRKVTVWQGRPKSL